MIYEKRVFVCQPASLLEAIRVVRRVESARKACQVVPSVEKKKSVNVVSASTNGNKTSTEIRKLKEIVLGMNEQILELEAKLTRLRLHGAAMRWYVLLAANLAILLRIVHTKKRKQSLWPAEGEAVPVRPDVVIQAPIVVNDVKNPAFTNKI